MALATRAQRTVRPGLPEATVGRHAAVELTAETGDWLWIPPGFAHGFVVLSESADFLYKTTDYYAPASERSIAWNDPEIGIEWPIADPLLSARDASAPLLSDVAPLPVYE